MQSAVRIWDVTEQVATYMGNISMDLGSDHVVIVCLTVIDIVYVNIQVVKTSHAHNGRISASSWSEERQEETY